jgi:hypothetical protein
MSRRGTRIITGVAGKCAEEDKNNHRSSRKMSRRGQE